MSLSNTPFIVKPLTADDLRATTVHTARAGGDDVFDTVTFTVTLRKGDQVVVIPYTAARYLDEILLDFENRDTFALLSELRARLGRLLP